MPYHEQSLLNGLICGLSATAGRPLDGPIDKEARHLIDTKYDWDLFVTTFASRIILEAPYPFTIEYNYGPKNGAKEKVFRHVNASKEIQVFYHVVQLPEAVKVRDYTYSFYFYDRRWYHEVHTQTPDLLFRADTMYFPRYGQTYPGSPDRVRDWHNSCINTYKFEHFGY